MGDNTMNKYIDADKLITEIESQIEEDKNNLTEETKLYYGARQQVRSKILHIIDSLQREQPIQVNTLTWKDINDLERIINNVHYEFRNGIGEKSFGKEVLERFREERDDQEQPVKSYCKEHCQGYKDTGGKCFFGWNCSAIKQQETTELEQLAKLREMTHEIREAHERGVEIGLKTRKSIWHNVAEEVPTKNGLEVIVACRNKNKEDGIWLYDLIQCWEGKWEPRENWETPVKWAYVKDLDNTRKEK